jgi:DNA-binding NarL/FixJ family response regulator
VNPAADRIAVIFDPYPLWLDAIESSLTGIGLEVVGRATKLQVAVELVDRHQPDLLVSEQTLLSAGTSPGEVLRGILDRHPDLRVVILSGHDNPTQRETAFEGGVAAYVLKTAQQADLALAVRQAFDHSIFFAGQQVETATDVRSDAAEAVELTPRELEILQLVAEGHSNGDLARMLWVTEQTIKFHLSNIYRKLDVANRTEAGRWAQRNGLLPSLPGAGSANGTDADRKAS